MTRYKKVLAVCVMVAAILPNLYVIVKGEESYPFTQAPMFGHYIGDSTIFYDFRFVAEGSTGAEEVWPSHQEQKNDLATQRFFFHSVYGSVEKDSPFGHFQDDTPEKLTQRMNNFFSVYFRELPEQEYTSIQLIVDRYNRSYELQETHTVGYYDLTSQGYNHTWKSGH